MTDEKKPKNESCFKSIMGLLSSLAGIVKSILDMKNREARQKDTEEFRRNEEAKKEIELRNEGEILVDTVQNEDDEKKRQEALDEIRRRISK